jgi:hypothetical protein
LIRLLQRQFEVPVGLPDAWRFLARVEDWPSWAAHIRRIDLTPPGELGPDSSGRIHLDNGLRSTFRMQEFRPGKSWRWVGPFLWLTVHYDHQFDAVAPRRTRLTWVVDAEGFGVAMFGRLFAAIYSRNLDRAIPMLVSTIAGETK